MVQLRALGARLPHDVVAEVAHEAAVQGRQVVGHRGAVGGEDGLDGGQDALVQRDALGEAAAQQSQAIEAEQKQGQQGQGFELDASQKVELNEINGQQAKTLAKELNRDNENGDQVKQARAREIAERFKEKAARDREQSRSFSR